jgi:uncharacterized protein with von Willebrand factor type A (vWA) domain
MAEAKRMIARLTLPVAPMPARRWRGAVSGRDVDTRRTLRSAMRQGGELHHLARKRRRARWPRHGAVDMWNKQGGTISM